VDTNPNEPKTEAQFDGAATPDLALVDVQFKDVVWLDAKKPSTWETTIMNQMGEAWGIDVNKIPAIEGKKVPSDTRY